jgi:hypothetical protein
MSGTSPSGCFRCHDGKHLNAANQAIRLECNLCHSIPVAQGAEGLVTNIEIVHGPEPDSHRDANWIGLHNEAYLSDNSCANCHSMSDDGGTSNTSFCSNSACHGTPYPYVGFDAPALRKVLKAQLSEPNTVTQSSQVPTWKSFIGALLATRCGTCHGANPSAGLDLTTFASAMSGGNEGPVITAGDSANSILVQAQSHIPHANLSGQELDAVKRWIDAGAPEE